MKNTAAATGLKPQMTLSSLLFAGSFVIPALVLYTRNSSEFTFRLSGLLVWLVPLGVFIAAAVFAVQFALRRTAYFPLCHALVLSLGTTIYLQSAFFTLIFVTEAEDARGSGMALQALFDLVLLAAPVASAIVFRQWVLQNSIKLSIIVLLTQLSPLAGELLSFRPVNYDFYENSVDETDKFVFGARDNIFLVVVDSMSENSLKKTLAAYPDLAESLKDFSVFDRLESPIPHTRFAIPAMLSGEEFPAGVSLEDDGAHLSYLRHSSAMPDALTTALKSHGFRLEGYPFMLQTISYSPRYWDNIVARSENERSVEQFHAVYLYRITPFAIKYLFARQYLSFRDHFVTPTDSQRQHGGDTFDMVFLRRLRHEARKGTAEKMFKYYHLQGTHSPYIIDENTTRSLDTNEVRQLRGSLRNIETLIEKLRQFDLYDRSIIVISGDHTELYTPETVMLIKRPGDCGEQLTFHSQPCKVREIAGTILAETGLRPPEFSVFSRNEKAAGSTRKLPERPVISFDELRKIDLAPFTLPARDTFSKSFQLNGSELVIDDHDVKPEHIFTLGVLVENIADGSVFSTESAEISGLKSPLYYRIPLVGLPDGEYRLYLKMVSEDSTLCNSLPRFIAIEKGNFSLRLRPRYIPEPRPIEYGYPVTFNYMDFTPELDAPPDAELFESSLRLTEDSVITLRLPDSAEPLRLELTIMLETGSPARIEVWHRNQRLTSHETAPRDRMYRIFVTLPTGLKQAELSFKTNTTPKSVFRLREIGLVQ